MASTVARGAGPPPPTGEAERREPTSRIGHAKSLAVTVLAGGPGAEREVSLASGKAVHSALLRLGHRPILRDIAPADLAALEGPADFFFIALHGEFGEDGAVQRELERRGLRYSGSGPDASRVAMNKVQTKRRMEAIGLPTPSWRLADRDNSDAVALTFPTPAVVKPVCSGSSVDLTIARNEPALRAALERTTKKYGQALVESYVRGQELTVGILGQQALPVCEIRTKREFYDYQAKYVDDDTEYRFEIDLPAKLLHRVQQMSLSAHQALGLRVLSRVDWMIDAVTLEPFLLEVNTIPGFTSHSLVPKAAARVGIDFDQLCQRVIDLSLACP